MYQMTRIQMEQIKFALRRIKVLAALLQNKDLVEENLIDCAWIVNKIRVLACDANLKLENKEADCGEKCEPVCSKPVMPKPVKAAPKATTVEGQMKVEEMDNIINKYGDEKLKNLYYDLKKQWKVSWIEIMIKGFK